jgi:hypothetical protein
VPEVGLMAVTGKITLAREAQFTEGPTTRIQKALRERSLVCDADYIDMSRRDCALTIVFGVELPKNQ